MAAGCPQRHRRAANGAYVEPGLLAAEAATVSVIVTAADAATAAAVVEAAGGLVTSDLWLIDAVAATVASDAIAELAADARVVSIVDNKGVSRPTDPLDWDGWVTDYRFPVPWDGVTPDVAGFRHLETTRCR